MSRRYSNQLSYERTRQRVPYLLGLSLSRRPGGELRPRARLKPVRKIVGLRADPFSGDIDRAKEL